MYSKSIWQKNIDKFCSSVTYWYKDCFPKVKRFLKGADHVAKDKK
jgi:hypothetical protein